MGRASGVEGSGREWNPRGDVVKDFLDANAMQCDAMRCDVVVHARADLTLYVVPALLVGGF